ncbi:MAG: DNA translocase FtsK [Dermatophilaceae bacterium]
MRRDFDDPVDLNGEEFGLVHEDDRRKPAPAARGRIEPSMSGEAGAAPAQSPVQRRVVSAPPLGADDPPFDVDDHAASGRYPPRGGRRCRLGARPRYPAPRATAPAAAAPARQPARPAAPPRQEHRLSSLRAARSSCRRSNCSPSPRASPAIRRYPTRRCPQNARLLEGVLDDFGVRGEIINVRPGPVVTLYELEPAPGIKSVARHRRWPTTSPAR